jgi:hypothetical protein
MSKIKDLKPEFEQLPYIERLEFWYKHFGFFDDIDEKAETKYEKGNPIFSIYPKNTDELFDYNDWKYKKIDIYLQRIGAGIFDKYVNLENLKSEFNNRYNNSIDKDFCLTEERNDINKCLEEKPQINEKFIDFKRGATLDFSKKLSWDELSQYKKAENIAFYEKFLNTYKKQNTQKEEAGFHKKINNENLDIVCAILRADNLRELSRKIKIIENTDLGELVNEIEANLVNISDKQGRVAYFRKIAKLIDTTKRIAILETWVNIISVKQLKQLEPNEKYFFENMVLFKEYIMELSQMEIGIFSYIYNLCGSYDINCCDISKKIYIVGKKMTDAEAMGWGWENNRVYYTVNFSKEKFFVTDLISTSENENLNQTQVLLLKQKPTLEEDKKIVSEFLRPLSGFWNRNRIMKLENFERLVRYVHFMVEFEKLPENIEPILSTNIHVDFIRQTFYQLHKKLYGKKKRQYWISFLHAAFKQFENWDIESTNKNFSTYRGFYDKDVEKITF